MKLTFQLMQQILPSLNRRKITWRMIERACKRLNTQIYCVPLNLDGYFVPAELLSDRKAAIFINSNLSDNLQIATAVHELKHAAFDANQNAILFSNHRKLSQVRKFEYEAAAIGAIAILPQSRLRFASRGLFDEDDEFLDRLWKIRLEIRGEYGI